MNLKFSRTQHEDHLFIDVTAEGLLIGITGGWSVGILPQDATGLVKKMVKVPKVDWSMSVIVLYWLMVTQD
ncbi:hypothetical protein QW180_31590 [Vibrio sinaloensis]|nr:hypothetical protein [Vibrio sinaloensis]